MKRLLFIVLLMCFTHLQAQVRVGETEACLTAEQFVSQQGKQDKPTLTLSEEIKSEQTGQTNLFVFSMEPKGYVIVSALNDLLAYSFESSMPALDELPDHVAYWIDLYNEQNDYLLEHPDQIKRPTKQQHSVGPLLTSVWGQGCYHNADCPQDELGPCQHVSAGCIAIAMAQIMYYHKRPIKGNGSTTYSCPPYGNLSANFGETTYLWDEMTDTLHGYNFAVAKLIYHCGVSVEMVYGAHQSSASSRNALSALRQQFSYPCSTLSSRSNYNDENWNALLKENLEQQLPMMYLGYSDLGGHAFVCDGYDDNGLFHFNFGWDGVADGYYNIDSPYGFSEHQAVIHDIYPVDDISIHSDEHGIIYVAPDGTGDGSSWEQATNELRMAIFKAYLGDCSIWVKEGCYYGNPADDYAFLILRKCSLYEAYDYDLSQRDFEAHPSILDGTTTCKA